MVVVITVVVVEAFVGWVTKVVTIDFDTDRSDVVYPDDLDRIDIFQLESSTGEPLECVWVEDGDRSGMSCYPFPTG